MNPSLPSNPVAERATLGACLMHPGAISRAAALAQPTDFYEERHGLIYAAIVGCAERRIPPDTRTVATALMRAQQLDLVGGAGYLADLTTNAPASAHVEHYARDVQRTARLRRLVDIGGRIAAIGYTTDDDDQAYQEAQELLTNGMTRRLQGLLVPLGQVLDDLYDELGQRAEPATATGIRDYDTLTGGGLWPGELIVPAGRAGHGKSSWVGTITANVARQGKRVAFFGLEMQRREIARRLLSSESGIDGMQIRKRDLDADGMHHLAMTIGAMREWPVLLAQARVSMSEVRTAVLRDMAEHGPPALIVIDYIQLIKTADRRRSGTRDQELGEVTRELKELADEAQCTVMAPSQLNRDIERRGKEPMPTLADLRESGNIENDADAVDFIVNPAKFDLHTYTIAGVEYPTKNLGVLIRRKGRNTGDGQMPLYFDATHTTFRDMARGRVPEGY